MKSTPSIRMEWLNLLNRDPQISATDFRIAYAIANHVNDRSGRAWPKKEKIAKSVHVSARTVQRTTGVLESLAYLKITPRSYATNFYELTFPRKTLPEEVRTSDVDDGSARHLCPPPGDIDVTQTYFEPTSRTYLRARNGDSFATGKQKKQTSGSLLNSPRRGRFEIQVLEMLGRDAEAVMDELPETLIEFLLQRARAGTLSEGDINKARVLAGSMAKGG